MGLQQQNVYLEERIRDLQAKVTAKGDAVTAAERREEELRRQIAALQERAAQLDMAGQQAEADLRHQQDAHRQQLQAQRDEMETLRKAFASTKADLNGMYQQELRLRQALETSVDQERLLRGEAESRTSQLQEERKAADVAFDSERCESNREVCGPGESRSPPPPPRAHTHTLARASPSTRSWGYRAHTR